jgi:hypothetical protein
MKGVEPQELALMVAITIYEEFTRKQSRPIHLSALHRCLYFMKKLNLSGRAVVEELFYAIKGDSWQIKRKGDDENVFF